MVIMNFLLELQNRGLEYRGLNIEFEVGETAFGATNSRAEYKFYLIKNNQKICIVHLIHLLAQNHYNLSLKYDSKPVRQVQGILFADLKRQIQSVIDSYVIVKSGEQMSPWMALHSLLNIIER